MLTPVLVSLRTATAAGLVTIFLGVGAAWAVAKVRIRGVRMIVDGLLTLPLVLPPTVAGFFLLYIFGVRGPVGRLVEAVFSVRIAFTWGATVLAAVVISFPLMYRSSLAALLQVDENTLHAARTLGMGEGELFLKIWLPQAREGLIGGAILSFTRGLGEFGATAMLAGNVAGRTRTLPLAVYSEVAAGNMDAAMDYVLILVCVSFLAVALLNSRIGKGGARNSRERAAKRGRGFFKKLYVCRGRRCSDE